MERRFAVHAGAHRQALIAAIVLWAAPALAAPSNREAKAQFDRGVAAYQHGDFAGAAEAFGRSNALEADAETLFAWAQAERKIGHCDKAIELYGTLLAMDLPAENKSAIKIQLSECTQIVAAQNPPPVEPPKPVPVAPVEHPREPVAAPIQPAAPEGRPWFRDPIGDGLVIVGAAGVGVGIAMLVSGHSADQSKASATTYGDYQALADKAHSRGEIGVIGGVAGVAFIAVGIVWYAMHEDHPGDKTVTPTGGGFALTF